MTAVAAVPVGVDGRIRTAELDAYRAHDLKPVERVFSVDTGYGTTEVRIVEFGRQNPGRPVLLLHGVASVNVIAAPLIRSLSRRRVIAVDWPGHGLSGPCILPEGASLRDHACTVITSILSTLDVPVVDLVGHSLGAQFSLYASLGMPHRVHRVVLLGAPGAALPGVRPVAAMKILAMRGIGPTVLSMPMSRSTFRRTNDQMLGTGSVDAMGTITERAGYLLGTRTANAASIASFFRALIRHGKIRDGVALSDEELGRVTHPVLMAWGDLDVFQTPSRAAGSIASFRDLRLRRIPGSGHAPWLQQESAVTDSILLHLA